MGSVRSFSAAAEAILGNMIRSRTCPGEQQQKPDTIAATTSQVAQLHSSAARVELVKLIGEVRGTARGESAFDTSFAELDNRVAERNAEADRSLALGNADHGLWFTGGMASLEERLSLVLQPDQPATEPVDAQPFAISE